MEVIKVNSYICSNETQKRTIMNIYIKTRIELEVMPRGQFWECIIYNHVLEGTPNYTMTILETFKDDDPVKAKNKAKAWLHNNGITNLEDETK